MRAIFPAFLLACCGTFAADIDSIAVSFAAESPAIAAEKARLASEYAEARAENVLEGPEAEFEYKFGSHENRWGLGVGQSFDWPGVYAARSNANNVRRSALEMLYESRLAEKAVEIKLAVIRYRRASEIYNTCSEIIKNFELLKDTYSQSFARGECTVLDLRRIEIEFFKASVEVNEAETALRSAEAELIGLGGNALAEAAAAWSYTCEAPRSFSFYEEAMEAANPEMAYYKQLTTLAEAEMKVSRRSLLPSFKLSFIHDFEEGMHFNGFGVGISLPSWGGKQRMAAAHGKALAATGELTDYRTRMAATLRADYERAGRLYNTIENSLATFGDSDYTRLLKKALDAGSINLYQYITDYLEYTSTKITFIGLLYDYAETHASLSRYSILRP